MKKKYRIKLKNGKVFGPDDEGSIKELIEKYKLGTDILLQYFPKGEWKELNEFEEFQLTPESEESEDKSKDILEDDGNSDLPTEETEPSPKLGAIQPGDGTQTIIRKKEHSEFQFSTDNTPDINPDYEKLEKEMEESEKNESDEEEIEKSEDQENDNELGNDKTVIVTPLERPEEQPSELSPEKNEDLENKEAEEEVEEEEEEVDTGGATVVFNLDDISLEEKEEVNEEVKASENELQEVKEVEDEERAELEGIEDDEEYEIEEGEEGEDEEDEEEDEEDDAPIKEKKKLDIKKIVIILGILYVAFEFLSPEEKKEKVLAPRFSKISFPIISEFLDKKKSKESYEKGLKFYSRGNYLSKLMAASNFRNSLSLNFKKNQAIGNLILVYSELLPNAKKPRKAGDTIIKLMQIARNRSLTDINIVLGSSNFYFFNKKYHTALNLIENYLRIGKPNLKLFSRYLESLIKVGNFDQARKLFEKLKKLPNKTIESYLALISFLEVDQKFDEAKKIAEAGLKQYRRSVGLHVRYSDLLIRTGEFKKLSQILKKIKSLEAGKSPYYLSRYYEFMGILAAVSKRSNLAVKFFKRALKLRESDELRSKLINLDSSGNKAVAALVVESKVLEKMALAKIELKNRNWEAAFKYAIAATDLDENYMSAQLLLAEIQVKRGYYGSALETLDELRKDHPYSTKVLYNYFLGLIDSYKLTKVKKEMVVLAQSKFKNTSEYFSILSRYYIKNKKYSLALRYLNEALKIDPLNDENFFLMGKYFLKFRKYNRSKIYLAKAIELDPQNIQYRALWGNILYELESSETAIGYLRDILEKKPDNPKILGDIAMYYYKSGQIKEFDEYKAKIEKSVNKDSGFYDFLVKSSKLNENVDDVIKYSEQLINLNPGDLDSRMALGEYLFKMQRYPKARKIFNGVKERLVSYPKVNYFLAKIWIRENKLEEAEKAAKEEVKNNPHSEDSFVIQGQVLQLKKDYFNAARKFEKAVTINGKSVDALQALATIKRGQNFLTEARELYLRALAEEPDRPELHREIGHVYQGIGQSELAIESFDTYLKLNPLATDKKKINQLIKSLKN